ncbi:MAG: hypothetical protein QE272_01220 [Nevskia sp.]|nr:hypothetical protein [Nevskia sp.]
MDEVTQQNAALVEEATAAARSLESQAEGLSTSVAGFRVAAVDGGAGNSVGSPAPAVAAAAGVRPVLRTTPAPRGKAAAAAIAKPARVANGQSDQWTEF